MQISETRTGEDHSGERFRRPGRLTPFPGAPGAAQVRCACDRCGSHLLAAARPDGRLDGACPVCLSRAVTPVDPTPAG